MRIVIPFLLVLLAFTNLHPGLLAAETKKIVFIAGPPSHGPGEHEHRAGCLLLQSCLGQVPGVTSIVYTNGWPSEPEKALTGAATIIIYSDGGEGHPLLRDDRLAILAGVINKGAGLVCLHYAVEPTKARGEKEFLDWIGGCFETYWSVNPTWTADYQALPPHPITSGVKPFKIEDEWYFYMRFRNNMERMTPILSAVAPLSTMDRDDGPHEGNPAVRASVNNGEVQHMAWAYERPDGGRGFGFTGGHFHRSWGNDELRKLVLNAILWTAKVEVPKEGVKSRVSAEDLRKNLDTKQ